MATFTTWAALKADMLNTLASRDFSRASASVAGSHAVTWASFSEFQQAYTWVCQMAEIEAGGATASRRRTYARDGGRG